MLPKDMRVVLGSQGGKDTRHGFVALVVRERYGRRQGNVMEGHRRAGAVPEGLHVVQRLGGSRHRRGDANHARSLVGLPR